MLLGNRANRLVTWMRMEDSGREVNREAHCCMIIVNVSRHFSSDDEAGFA